jgi:hypothetical protein
MLLAALGSGCASADKNRAEASPVPEGIPAPVPPLFLSGTVAALLTNVDSFHARVVLERPAAADRSDGAAGELMGRGGKLLFAPQPGARKNKYSRVEDFSYIWNVDENRGFLLSGPLQGYAPISSATRFTNVVAGISGSGPAQEKISGYRCEKAEVKVIASDGSEAVLQVWRAMELKGMPLRITGTANGTPFTLTLSRVRLEPQPPDLFLPPSDFTKYSSGEMMMHELVARQHNLKRKRGWEPPPTDDVGFRNSTAPTRQP